MSIVDAGPTSLSGRSFEAYRSSFVQATSPQHQGIDNERVFEEALRDPRTVSVMYEGAEIPLLYPARYNSWLNLEYIAEKTGSVTDGIMAVHVPAVINGRGDLDSDFADKIEAENMAMVVDFPQQDRRKSLDAIKRMLEAQGLSMGYGHLDLGTQTYHAGLARPNNPKNWESVVASSSRLSDSRVEQVFCNGDYIGGDIWSNSKRLRLVPYRRMPEGLVDTSFEFVSSAFEKIKNHPCRQGWSPEEYREIAANRDSVVKLTAATQEDPETAVSVIAFGANLDDYPWVNNDYFKKRFPNEVDNGNLVYFPTVASNPNARGLGGLNALIQPIAVGFASLGEVRVCFDTCDRNKGLPDAISKFTEATGISTIEFDVLGVQEYSSFTFN